MPPQLLTNSDLEGMCRILSLWLRSNGSLELAIKQLEHIGSSLSIRPLAQSGSCSLVPGSPIDCL